MDALNNIKEFKIPLVLGSIGIILIIIAITLQIAKISNSSDVVFTPLESTPSSGIKIQVDIEGAVENPGVYELNEGKRISDALSIAGGLSKSADNAWIGKSLNLAAKLVDGGKIYIPSKGGNQSVKTQVLKDDQAQSGLNKDTLGVTTGLVNVNTASQVELEALSGIGPVTAEKIITGRPYNSVEELRTKKILGESLFGKLKDLLTVF